MRTEINQHGLLTIFSDTPLEAYALQKWLDGQQVTWPDNILFVCNVDMITDQPPAPDKSCDTCKFADNGGWVCHQKEAGKPDQCGAGGIYDKWEPSGSSSSETPEPQPWHEHHESLKYDNSDTPTPTADSDIKPDEPQNSSNN